MGILEEYWNTLQVDSLQSEPPGKPNYDINSLKTLNKRKKNNDSVIYGFTKHTVNIKTQRG